MAVTGPSATATRRYHTPNINSSFLCAPAPVGGLSRCLASWKPGKKIPLVVPSQRQVGIV